MYISFFQKDEVKCLKGKEILPNDTGLVYSERFKREIIPNVSSVHIPVEIYDGGSPIYYNFLYIPLVAI